MKLHAFAHGLLAGAVGVMALVAGSPIANADPEPFVPAPPSIINEITEQTPASVTDPRDRDGPQRAVGRRGMQCQNLWARCR